MAPNNNFHRLDALSTPAVPEQSISYPNPNVQGNPYIYLAVYSSVPVYEMMVRGIGVMRRRSDSFLNATQILKVAGVDKGKRTKILEKDIAMGVHEKVQGGYGRYQGTWIPFERAVELANAFNVSHLLSPLFDYTPPPPPMSLGNTPSAPITNRYAGLAPPPLPQPQQEGQSAATVLSKAREQGLLPEAGEGSTRKRSRDSGGHDDPKRPRVEAINGFHAQQASPNGAAEESWQLRRSNKPPPPTTLDPHLLESHKSILKSIFSLEPTTPHSIPDLSLSFPPDLDSDTPIDENSHTALHWAAALARISIVKALINSRADMYRGNNVGETPLIRAVLVTNNSDQDAFPRLLSILGPSLRTVDDTGRSVLHHAALVAGVKGRAASARYYMESVLEYVAREERGRFKDLVDAQDANGDTALNIAARVGNKALVGMLLEVGADKMVGNKLGLYPGDFGVEVENLAMTPSEAATASLRSSTSTSTSAPTQPSTDLLTSISTLLTSLSTDFQTELTTKSTQLESTRSALRAATADLASARQSLQESKLKAHAVDSTRQRLRNLERAIAEEDSFDWTGRTEIDGSPASAAAGPGFTYRGPSSTLSNLPTGINIEFDADPTGPTEGSGNALVHLMRLRSWYERVLGLLEGRVSRLEGGEAELEGRVRSVVGRCCGVEEGRVEEMLEGLLAGLESEGSGLEMTRVASFLSRVKDGSLQ